MEPDGKESFLCNYRMPKVRLFKLDFTDSLIYACRCKRQLVIGRDDYRNIEMVSCLRENCDAYWCKKCSQLAEHGLEHSCDGTAEFKRYVQQKKLKECPGKITNHLFVN
jgi:hypothetical protein